MNSTAIDFMLMGIQDWGQSETQRIAAVQGALDAAGFDATAHTGPIFGGIWHAPNQKPCSGPDGEAATKWLQALTDDLKRGEFNSEVRQIEGAIAARAAPSDRRDSGEG